MERPAWELDAVAEHVYAAQVQIRDEERLTFSQNTHGSNDFPTKAFVDAMADVFSTQSQLDAPNGRTAAEDKLTVMEVECIQAAENCWAKNFPRNLGKTGLVELAAQSALVEQNLQEVRKWFGSVHRRCKLMHNWLAMQRYALSDSALLPSGICWKSSLRRSDAADGALTNVCH